MNLAAEVQNLLLAATGVTAIVGSGEDARIWNGWQRDYVVPCVVVEVENEEEQNDLSGAGELLISALDVTCRAATQTAAHALWLAARSALAGYSGAFDLVIDGTAQLRTPKDDGGTAHWYDEVISLTALRTEPV